MTLGGVAPNPVCPGGGDAIHAAEVVIAETESIKIQLHHVSQTDDQVYEKMKNSDGYPMQVTTHVSAYKKEHTDKLTKEENPFDSVNYNSAQIVSEVGLRMQQEIMEIVDKHSPTMGETECPNVCTWLLTTFWFLMGGVTPMVFRLFGWFYAYASEVMKALAGVMKALKGIPVTKLPDPPTKVPDPPTKVPDPLPEYHKMTYQKYDNGYYLPYVIGCATVLSMTTPLLRMCVYAITSVLFLFTMEKMIDACVMFDHLESFICKTTDRNSPNYTTIGRHWGVVCTAGVSMFGLFTAFNAYVPAYVPSGMCEIFIIIGMATFMKPAPSCHVVKRSCLWIMVFSCGVIMYFRLFPGSFDADGMNYMMPECFLSYWMYVNTVVICTGIWCTVCICADGTLNKMDTFMCDTAQYPPKKQAFSQHIIKRMMIAVWVGFLNIFCSFAMLTNTDFIGANPFGQTVITNVCGMNHVTPMCMYQVEDCMRKINHATSSVTLHTRDTHTSALDSIEYAESWLGMGGPTTYLNKGYEMTETTARLMYIETGYKVHKREREELIKHKCIERRGVSVVPMLLAYNDNTFSHYVWNTGIFSWDDLNFTTDRSAPIAPFEWVMNFFKTGKWN
jgi:hypothetical protein